MKINRIALQGMALQNRAQLKTNRSNVVSFGSSDVFQGISTQEVSRLIDEHTNLVSNVSRQTQYLQDKLKGLFKDIQNTQENVINTDFFEIEDAFKSIQNPAQGAFEQMGGYFPKRSATKNFLIVESNDKQTAQGITSLFPFYSKIKHISAQKKNLSLNDLCKTYFDGYHFRETTFTPSKEIKTANDVSRYYSEVKAFVAQANNNAVLDGRPCVINIQGLEGLIKQDKETALETISRLSKTCEESGSILTAGISSASADLIPYKDIEGNILGRIILDTSGIAKKDIEAFEAVKSGPIQKIVKGFEEAFGKLAKSDISEIKEYQDSIKELELSNAAFLEKCCPKKLAPNLKDAFEEELSAIRQGKPAKSFKETNPQLAEALVDKEAYKKLIHYMEDFSLNKTSKLPIIAALGVGVTALVVFCNSRIRKASKANKQLSNSIQN